MRCLRLSARVALIMLVQACATTSSAAGSRDVRFTTNTAQPGGPVSEFELEQDLERFTGAFIDRIGDAADPLAASSDPAVRVAAMRRTLLYDSSALAITSGPLADMNLLDMIVFVSLCREVVVSHWIPVVFGEAARPLEQAFAASDRDIWDIGRRVMSTRQVSDLRALIQSWREEHADQVRVENVRFSDFALHAGKVARERASRFRGLFGTFRSAANTADRSLLFAERALFLAQRMPFLIRLQSRLGAQEILDDTLVRLPDADRLLAEAQAARPLAHDVSALLANSEAAAREARLLVQKLEPLIAYATQPRNASRGEGPALNAALDSGNRLLDKSLALLERATALTQASQHGIAQLDAQIDRVLRRLALYLIAIAAAVCLLFWGGYYLAKRYTQLLPAQSPQAANTAPDTRRARLRPRAPALPAHRLRHHARVPGASERT